MGRYESFHTTLLLNLHALKRLAVLKNRNHSPSPPKSKKRTYQKCEEKKTYSNRSTRLDSRQHSMLRNLLRLAAMNDKRLIDFKRRKWMMKERKKEPGNRCTVVPNVLRMTHSPYASPSIAILSSKLSILHPASPTISMSMILLDIWSLVAIQSHKNCKS